MRNALILLVLAGCGGLKTVDADALSEVEPDAVEMLAERAERVDEAERALEEAQKRHEEVEKYVADAEIALKSAEKDLERAKSLKADAVGSGDYDTAKDVEGDYQSATQTYQRRSTRAAEQRAMADLTEQNVDLAEARLEVARAELEHARAAAAAEGGADVKLDKFEKQLAKRQDKRAKEEAELEDMEASTGVSL